MNTANRSKVDFFAPWIPAFKVRLQVLANSGADSRRWQADFGAGCQNPLVAGGEPGSVPVTSRPCASDVSISHPGTKIPYPLAWIQQRSASVSTHLCPIHRCDFACHFIVSRTLVRQKRRGESCGVRRCCCGIARNNAPVNQASNKNSIWRP